MHALVQKQLSLLMDDLRKYQFGKLVQKQPSCPDALVQRGIIIVAIIIILVYKLYLLP